MRLRAWMVAVAGSTCALVVAGCAGRRIEHGVFHSAKGYRVAVPPDDWTIVDDGRADLELRRGSEPVAMLVNASCDSGPSRASLDVLARHLLIGLRGRSVISSERVSVDGKAAQHSVLEARLGDRDDPIKLEVYVMRGARCVYDLVYAAAPESFERWEPVFRRVVDTFAAE